MLHEIPFAEFESLCAQNKLYQKFNEAERKSFYKLASKKTLKAEEVLFYSSEKDGAEFYILTAGILRLTLNSGKEKIYRPGSLFGEISVLDGSARMGTVTAITEADLLAFDGDLLFSEEVMSPKMSLAIFKGLVGYVIGYLDEKLVNSTEYLIEKGEGVTIEFKESLSKKIKPDVIKTICAFLNTRGGTILIGITDHSEVIGLKISKPKEIDNYKQSIIQILRDRVGAQFTTNIHFNTEKVEEYLLLRINCIPSAIPAVLEDKAGQHFYMRSGPSNIKAPNIKELLSYYKKRFESTR